jgi:hypothetical protein
MLQAFVSKVELRLDALQKADDVLMVKDDVERRMSMQEFRAKTEKNTPCISAHFQNVLTSEQPQGVW